MPPTFVVEQFGTWMFHAQNVLRGVGGINFLCHLFKQVFYPYMCGVKADFECYCVGGFFNVQMSCFVIFYIGL